MYKKFPYGVATGSLVQEIFEYAKEKIFAIPAVNVIGSNTMNAVMETSAEVNAPVIIQLSNGGATFHAGKGLSNQEQKAAIKGSIACAKHIHELAKYYKSTVILHTDHCSKPNTSWIDGLIHANEEHYKHFGRTLFSSHMLDLSQESLEINIGICEKYFERMNKINMTIEIELGVTGGEEDGMDNSHIENNKLYTQPKEVSYAYERLMKISKNFIIAASFGNVHGVYKPGNVVLRPVILNHTQKYIQKKFDTKEKPVFFVFHGGSGSSVEEIQESISYGVVKINVDTDLQYAFTCGVRDYMNKNKEYLKQQIGNPKGKYLPNKKYYDPRVWLREGEKSFKSLLKKYFELMNNINTL
ncbi:MAG: class II fructose-bisphosphate aldolase [Flavobacteriales bacterium]|jgi:fructose-bisphosphate aldolase class II|uniref:class II fructose-bisphosphate aldolase n=1 Tax=Blattabacterium sp. (Mastotermes darwiniensis) TaxID=39768 RepID=UPI000231DDCF|nr:class II fructose-bisphosphate aldolase [Blattabacterium sp. (Mastotermes darwiniensis)]AER40515.1 fructose 1,6-bisphosphate aldolase [Blattabacterium sp. (Mastotermes darwiniensis) str. MADAR]MDR1804970.1 class II fructose-bisphosphate aldolase [Flavobacteriales bacterium]